MAPPVLDFWFDFASTYSYLSAMRVEDIARDNALALRWRPFLLGPIFHDQGWNDSPFNIYPAKGRYMWRDMERRTVARGLPFHRPDRFPQRSVLAARVALVAEADGWCGAFARAVFAANFAAGHDISDLTVVAAIVDELGHDGGRILEAAGTGETKDGLRRQTERARELGLFGAPSFTVGDEVFWGDDRLEDAVAWCLARGD